MIGYVSGLLCGVGAADLLFERGHVQHVIGQNLLVVGIGLVLLAFIVPRWRS